MIVAVDPRSAVPPYEQLRSQVADLIATGALPVGERLPTVRGLAADLGLAPGTVARAYRELERDGHVLTRGRHGTVVAPRPVQQERERLRLLADAAQDYVRRARALSVDDEDAVRAVQRALA